MTYPDTSAAALSWVDAQAGTYPDSSPAVFAWDGGEVRAPKIEATSSAEAVLLATAVATGVASGASSADGTHSDRFPVITGSAFVVGTENEPGVTQGVAAGMAVSGAVGDGLIRTVGRADGAAAALAPSLIWLTTTGRADGAGRADGRAIFNRDTVGRVSCASRARAWSRADAVTVGVAHGRATVGTAYRPGSNTNPLTPFSPDGRTTGRAAGRATVGRKPRWRLTRVIIPAFGAPSAGEARGASRVTGVAAHG